MIFIEENQPTGGVENFISPSFKREIDRKQFSYQAPSKEVY